MFVVVRNTKSTSNNQDYMLNIGDIIKLGRIKLKIKFFTNAHPKNKIEFYPQRQETDNENETERAEVDIFNEAEDSPFKAKLDDSCQCKICWSSEQTVEDPLLNSCNCNGSMRYIHYKCLQHWLKQKMTRKEVDMEQGGKVVTFTWKTFECEICKQSYPFTFINKGK